MKTIILLLHVQTLVLFFFILSLFNRTQILEHEVLRLRVFSIEDSRQDLELQKYFIQVLNLLNNEN